MGRDGHFHPHFSQGSAYFENAPILKNLDTKKISMTNLQQNTFSSLQVNQFKGQVQSWHDARAAPRGGLGWT